MTTTRDGSSEVKAAEQFPAQVRAAEQFPAQPARITLIAIPLIYAGMGIALGTTAGLALAIMSAPPDVSAALNDSTPATSVTSATSTSPGIPSSASENSAPAVLVQVADHSDSAAHRPGAVTAQANPAPRPERSHALRSTLVSRRRASSKNPFLRTVRVHKHRARRITDLAQSELASVPEVVPEQLDGGQRSFNEGPKPSSIYTEGDFTVADYDAKGGTIESNDGRTFVVGITIVASNASSWDDYLPKVHYRCSQTGSCTLSGPGMVAPNARLI